MFRFRPHRRSLVNALAEMVTLKNKAELVQKIRADLDTYSPKLVINNETITVKDYGSGMDERMNPPWDTHIVLLDGYGPLGFTDKMVD